MALEGPRLIYTRADGDETDDTLHRALRLAREVEELLEETSAAASTGGGDPRSTRIVRAMAASLADELEAIVRGARKSRLSS